MTPSRYKTITPCDFFKFYPYKKQIPHSGNTIPFPYVKKEEVVDNHPHSLTWFEWIEIVNTYIDVLRERLYEGKPIQLDNKTGIFQFKKAKCKKFLDRKKSKEKGIRVYRGRNEFENYFFKLTWMRKKSRLLTTKWLWKVEAHSRVLLGLYKEAMKDYTFIYKFTD